MDPKAFIRVERANYILGGLFIALTAILGSQAQALGVACGVVLSSLNFSIIRRLVTQMMSGKPSDRQRVAALFIPKMGLLMAAVALVIFFLPISPMAFAAGFSVFLASIAIESVRFLLSPPSQEPSSGDDDSEGVGS